MQQSQFIKMGMPFMNSWSYNSASQFKPDYSHGDGKKVKLSQTMVWKEVACIPV